MKIYKEYTQFLKTNLDLAGFICGVKLNFNWNFPTTKCHLREFDRYLLFLVDYMFNCGTKYCWFIDPVRSQIEWPNTVIIVWGPLRLKRRKMSVHG